MWSWDKRFLGLAAAVLAFDAAWVLDFAPSFIHRAHIEASLVYETDGNSMETFPGPLVYGRYIEEHTSRLVDDGKDQASVEFKTTVFKLPKNEVYWQQSKVLTYDKRSLKVVGGQAQMHFPPHVEKRDYAVRMFSYIPDDGVVFRFAGEEEVVGVDTYKFTFDAPGLDWTDNYSYTLVPGTRILSHDWGTVWIEPESGIMVNHKENWIASAVGGPFHGMDVDDGTMWFASDTVTKQAFRAQNLRRASILYERVLPLALLGTAAIIAGLGVRRLQDTLPGVSA
jgi:hypothetical protein